MSDRKWEYQYKISTYPMAGGEPEWFQGGHYCPAEAHLCRRFPPPLRSSIPPARLSI